MSRLYDRILASGIDPRYQEFWDGLGRGPIEAALRDCAPVLVADNVAEYTYENYLGETMVPYRDLPNLAPPFEKFFIECRRPRALDERARSSDGWVIPYAWGLLIRGWDVRSYRTQLWDARDQKRLERVFDEPGCRWGLDLTLLVENYRKKPVAVYSNFILPVGEDGSIITGEGGQAYISAAMYSPHELPPEYSGTGALLKSDMGWALPLMLAISFLHCKNVVRTEVAPPPALSKKHRKKHGKDLVRYHVLQIDPMKEVLAKEGRSAEVGVRQALHICRGHFATYSKEKPLFGKVSGTFWKPQHVRGSQKEGIVLKDYQIQRKAAE